MLYRFVTLILLALSFSLSIPSTYKAEALYMTSARYAESQKTADTLARILIHSEYCLQPSNDSALSPLPNLSDNPQTKQLKDLMIAYTALNKSETYVDVDVTEIAYQRLVLEIKNANLKTIDDLCLFLIQTPETQSVWK